MKVIVTGGTGMVGSHFMDAFRRMGMEVFGIARSSASCRMDRHPDQAIIRADILERDRLNRIFTDIRPDAVIHMAAQAFNGESWDSEYLTHQTNYIGTLNVLYCANALRKSGSKDVKVLLACSSAEYGNIKPEDCPLKESTPLKPWTPYGVSKVGTEMLGRQYHLNYQLPVYLPRMFIQVGPGHPRATAIQNFACQLAMIKKGLQKPEIHVGNLETKRDFVDVRDGVAAMILLMEKGTPGEAVNICNEKAYKMSEILKMLIEIADVDVKVISDPKLFRVADEPLLMGDGTKIRELGYQQKYDIHQTLTDVFNDWMGRV